MACPSSARPESTAICTRRSRPSSRATSHRRSAHITRRLPDSRPRKRTRRLDMNINKYTEKAQEAVISAQHLAEHMNHAQIEPEHLLLALVDQPEGIVPELLRKMGADPKPFSAALREDLSRQPQAYGGSQPSLSARLRKATDLAQNEAARLKDEFVSTEHLLLGVVSEG